MYPNNNNNKKKKNQKVKNKEQTGDGTKGGREVRESFILFFISSFHSQIYGNRTVDFCESGRQSWTTRRELRVGTNILAFHQTSRGRKFFYLCCF